MKDVLQDMLNRFLFIYFDDTTALSGITAPWWHPSPGPALPFLSHLSGIAEQPHLHLTGNQEVTEATDTERLIARSSHAFVLSVPDG